MLSNFHQTVRRKRQTPCFNIRRPGCLYNACLQEVESSFSPTSEAPFVAEICRKLEGLPLAIELAAGQVAALGVKGTVARLLSRLELLKLSHRTTVPRHRTLRATLDWSYDLLSDVERIVFRRIARFVGHFTLEAAQRVAGELGSGTSGYCGRNRRSF